MPIGTPTGYLDITNATLRGSQIVTTGYVGIANANPVNHLSVGSNLHINDTHSNVLQISGNINAAGVVLGGISIAPTFDLEIVTNTGNTTPYTVEFNNTATAFVTTANATIGDTLTASKLVGDGSAISEIQSSNVSDFASNVTRIGILETDLGSNVTRIETLETDFGSNVTRIETLETDFGSNVTRIETLETDFGSNVTRVETLETDLGSNVSRIGTLETDLGSNVTRIETLETDLGSNVTRITNLESGDLTIDGEKTFSSNLEVGTASLFVDATSGNVGIGTNSPQDTLHLYGSPLIQHSDSYSLSSAGWRKIGTFTASEAGARLKIRILGSFQYGAGSSRGGQTEIYGSINNGVGSVCNMSGTYNYIGQPAVTSVKFVQTGASELEYEVRAYFQTVTAHSFSVECTRGVFVRSWTPSSDPGNDSSTVEAAILTHNISENGNVGIGTSNPYAKLHVVGNSWVTNAMYEGIKTTDRALSVKKFVTGVNTATLSATFEVGDYYRGGIIKVYFTSGVSGQSTVATSMYGVYGFNFKGNNVISTSTIYYTEKNAGNSVSITLSNGNTLTVSGTMYSSFSYPLMEVEVYYAGGVFVNE